MANPERIIRINIPHDIEKFSEEKYQLVLKAKDEEIFRLNTMLTTVLQRPSFYTQTYQNYGDIMSERKISIDQSGASIGVGYSENVNSEQVGGTIHNYPPEQRQNLADAAAEIQQLLKQLEETYPTATEEEKETALAIKVQQEIKHNPTFKARLRSALKEGGIEALKVLFAPIGIPIEMVRGWIEAEAE
jgi:cell division protein ZapA (FtsZ GTPase activity inhibitor)